MLDTLFLEVLNLTITGSFVIVGVLIARFLMLKFPKKYSYLLWAVVLVRLLVPISWESDFSLMPTTSQPIFTSEMVYETAPQVDTGVEILDEVINPILPPATQPEASVNPIQIRIFIGRVLWMTGMVGMAVYGLVQYFLLKCKLATAIPLENSIYLSDNIPSPFVLGLFRPKIYLPSHLEEPERGYIIAHEQCHLKRFDHVSRVLAFVALTVHWFNPLVWVAFVLSERDMERSCDEAVMRTMEGDIRCDYANSLLRFATRGRLISATPLAFGEGDTKGRVKNVVGYKKPVAWVTLVSIVLALCVGVGLMSNAKEEQVEVLWCADSLSVQIISTNTTVDITDDAIIQQLMNALNATEFKEPLVEEKEAPDTLIAVIQMISKGKNVGDIVVKESNQFYINSGMQLVPHDSESVCKVLDMIIYGGNRAGYDNDFLPQAISDVAFVYNSDGVIAGREYLDAFEEASANREDANLQIIYQYTPDGAENPTSAVTDIVYENEIFTVTQYPATTKEAPTVRTYQYLVTETVPPVSSTAKYETCRAHYLVNDPDVTYWDIMNGFLSSQLDAAEDAYLIYVEYRYPEE